MSERYSTNPAIWLVPRVGSILPIQPAHSGQFFLQSFVRFEKKEKRYSPVKVGRYWEKLCPLSSVTKTSGTVFPNTDLPSRE